ncbi:MAG TPA: hypothetical protein VFW76_11830 [Ktedonobacterales bacterium]|nr:hypothetical protein [Ktedonobacterales bacterium]
MSPQGMRTISAVVLVGAFVILLTNLGQGWSFLLFVAALILAVVLIRASQPSTRIDIQAARKAAQVAQAAQAKGPRASASAVSSSEMAFALRIHAYTHISQVISPSSETGPEPTKIPVTGFSIVAEFACPGKDDVAILGFRADISQRTKLEQSGVMIHTSPELEPPQLEILLDENPPVIRPALKADGQPARALAPFPFTLHSGEQVKYFLAPITQNPDLTAWSLYVRWQVRGEQNETLCGTFQTTGDTGFQTFSPGGKEPEPTPANMVNAGHWVVQYNVPS